jgi:hypothetical protein
MKNNESDSEKTLRLINDLSAEAEHTNGESRAALEEAGIDPGEFVSAVRDNIRTALPPYRRNWNSWEAVRTLATVVAAASAAVFVVISYFNARAGAESQRQLARAQLIGPMLSTLVSDDPDRRALALVVVKQVDPAFASETEKQLTLWEAANQAQMRTALNRNSPYSSRIVAGLQKLQLSRDPNDRKLAIWNDLLPVLNEASKNRDDFVDVAIEYRRVLPLLRVRDPEVFMDSYWGELWILNILLKSKIDPVVEAARQQAPEPAIVEHIFEKQAPGLAEKDRDAFKEALAVYENTFKTVQ